jgi:hypothetical protein
METESSRYIKPSPLKEMFPISIHAAKVAGIGELLSKSHLVSSRSLQIYFAPMSMSLSRQCSE